MGSLETRCLVLGNTVGPAPALETPAQITLMGIPVKLTTPLTRSFVTANKDTLVILQWNLFLCTPSQMTTVNGPPFLSPRAQMWQVCSWLLWQPRASWRAVPTVPMQWQHWHPGSCVMWPQDRPVPQVLVPHRRPVLCPLSTRLLWQRFGPRLQTWVIVMTADVSTSEYIFFCISILFSAVTSNNTEVSCKFWWCRSRRCLITLHLHCLG